MANSITFHSSDDGTVTMSVTDMEGIGEQCYTYLRERPSDLIHVGRVVTTGKGVDIQTGIVVHADGTGRGVAWRVENAISDQTLNSWRVGFPGQQKAEPYLRTLSPQDRYTVVEEAKLRVGENVGWNFSGAVAQAAKDFRMGKTPCLDRWRESMAQHTV